MDKQEIESHGIWCVNSPISSFWCVKWPTLYYWLFENSWE